MGLGDLFQYPQDPKYPGLVQYDPNNYATTKGSALYQALQNGATQQGQTQAAADSRLPGMQGRVPGDAGNGNDRAILNAYGAMQPRDVQMGLGNWNGQNAFNQGIFNIDQNSANLQQQQFGNMLGAAAGYGAGALANNRAAAAPGLAAALDGSNNSALSNTGPAVSNVGNGVGINYPGPTNYGLNLGLNKNPQMTTYGMGVS